MHIQVVTFQLDGIDDAAYQAHAEQAAPAFAALPGLRAKIWLASMPCFARFSSASDIGSSRNFFSSSSTTCSTRFGPTSGSPARTSGCSPTGCSA